MFKKFTSVISHVIWKYPHCWNFRLRKESIKQQFNIDLSIRPSENLNNEKDSWPT